MIIDSIYEWAHIRPNSVAIIYNDTSLTYAEFARAIDSARRFFQGQQLSPGSTAGLLIRNLLDCWRFCIALRSLGLNTIVLRSMSQAQELHIRNLSCIITTEIEDGIRQPAMRRNGGAKLVIAPNTFAANIDQGDPPAPLERTSLYGGHFLYTSGTTGMHKKLFWSAQDESRRATTRAHFHRFDTRTILHNVYYPLWTGVGWKRPLSVWIVGGCVVIDDTTNTFSTFFRYDTTNTFLLAFMMDQLLSSHNQRSTLSLRPTLNVGGSVVKRHQVLRAMGQLNSDVIIEYASTELATPPLMSSVHNEDDIEWLLPEANRDVSVVNEEGILMPPNQEGFIRVALNELDFDRYWDNSIGGNSGFIDGYFYPGDMAVRRPDGRIRILGRADDVIIVRGQKMAAAPVEQDLQRYLGAGEVCLFSHLNDLEQEELIVAIESLSVPPQMKLAQIGKRFKVFDKVRFQVFKRFPRTDTGKVKRIVLKKLLTKKQSLPRP